LRVCERLECFAFGREREAVVNERLGVLQTLNRLVLADPWFDASSPEIRSMYKLTVAPEDAPDEPEYVELEFENARSPAEFLF
jgi:hypothetical protein